MHTISFPLRTFSAIVTIPHHSNITYINAYLLLLHTPLLFLSSSLFSFLFPSYIYFFTYRTNSLLLHVQELFTNGFVRLEKEHESLRDELSVAAAELADKDKRLATLTLRERNRNLALAMSPPRNRIEIAAVEEEMEALNQSLIEKDREISALQETIESRKHTRKGKEKDKDRDREKEKEREMKAKHYALQMEVMNLLTTVQAGREELSKKKNDLQDIARLVNDYKMREASAVARFAEISRQLDQRDSAADRMDGCLKVLRHTMLLVDCVVCALVGYAVKIIGCSLHSSLLATFHFPTLHSLLPFLALSVFFSPSFSYLHSLFPTSLSTHTAYSSSFSLFYLYVTAQ